MSELDRVKSFFTSKNIHASTLWMESCIQWYKSEHSQPSIQNMLHDIYEQWLLCDLRDMEIGSLPENLQSYTKIILQGKYAVQMHYVIDVSQPAYTQLQKIRNKRFIQDEDISDEYKVIQPKRVLNLILCDGVQLVKGMEYKPIKKLNTSLTPGIKLMISGPIECREGVLFLEEHNIEILGGEIEDLFVKNAYENVLAREINLPENPTPFPEINIKNEDICDLDDVKEETFDDDLIAQININEITRSSVQEKTEPKTETTPIIDEYDNYEEQLRDADFDLNDDYFDINVTEIASNISRNEQNNATKNTRQINNALENKPSTSSAYHNQNHDRPSTSSAYYNENQWQPSTSSAYHNRNHDQPSTSSAYYNENQCKPSTSSAYYNENQCQPSTSSAYHNRNQDQPSTSSAHHSRNQYEPSTSSAYHNRNQCEPSTSSAYHNESHFYEDLFTDKKSDQSRSKFPKLVPIEPFVYIQQLLLSTNHAENLSRSTYVVKARFKSLVTKLNFSRNQWSMKCEIEDSTGSIVVSFSNKVLEEIIGYTADEMTIMRREFATSNFHKDQILQALEKAKEKILSLADLITLDFSNFEEPTIVRIKPIAYNDLKLLEKRISL